MSNKKNILIVGTGTIGEPLVGLLSDMRKELDIGEVYFHKRRPLKDEVAKVNSLIARGAHLVVDPEKEDQFRALGHKPVLKHLEALDAADVVIDCTPAGNEAKDLFYSQHAEENPEKVFIAQGSEKGFGMPYAYGINDSALMEKSPNFIQVVSCNTHNIACLLKSLSLQSDLSDIHFGDFTCIRRANDISQIASFVASPHVGKHTDQAYGTHHARDAHDLLATLGRSLNIRSSALKLNSQYMHVIRFVIEINALANEKDVLNCFANNKFIGLTDKTSSNRVFSFGRDHGYYGRIFNQTIVSVPTLMIDRNSGKTRITGFCFTPQDGNSLLSSAAASLHAIHGEKYAEYMNLFDPYLFTEV